MKTIAKLGTFVVAATLAACAGNPASSDPLPFDADEPLTEWDKQGLTALGTQCTFVVATGLMTVTVADGETAVISRSAADSAILQNGQACDNPVTASTLKKIAINGSSGANNVLLDFTNGLFAVGTTSTASSGIAIDLLGGTDKLAIKGTSSADNFTFGASAILVNTDANRDITVAGVEEFIVSMGGGDDIFSAAGGGAAGAVFGTAVTVYGGAGNDTFQQGSAASPSETIWGGSGTDTVTYASRTAAVTVAIGTGASDGASGENDDVKADVEVVTGGSGDDTLTAGSAAATLNGGAGNDTLTGGAGNDTLNGDDGNDTFDEESAANGADVFNGGAGIDTVNYSGRSNAVTVTMDGAAANDGEAGENDNVKADVEGIKGGSGNDVITGNALSNIIEGGAGNDTLNGGAGDDVFVMGSASDGNDTISGGAGVDTVDYSARSNPITAVLDGTTASGESGESDVLGTDVENLYGGAGADSLTGNASDNVLRGGAANDTLIGLGGDDTLEGGAGDDTLTCGDGFDVTVGAVGTDAPTDCEL